MKKPTKGPTSRRSRSRPAAESFGGWMTPDGYRFSERLVALRSQGPVITLANELIAQHLAAGRRGLVVCGASSGVGVTFVTANLGVALAQAGVSTLIVDANFASPGLGELIRSPAPTPGLAQLLEDPHLQIGDVVQRNVLPGLSILYAGAGGGSADTLEGDRFQDLAGSCLRDYDCTLFDAPPANRSAVARTIGATVGYALLVAQRNTSYADDLGLLATQLAQDEITVIGSVLNKV